MLAQSQAMPGSADPLPSAAGLAAAESSLLQTASEVCPIFAEAAAKAAAAAGLMGMLMHSWMQMRTCHLLEDGVAGDQQSAVHQIAVAAGLQRQQQQQAHVTQALAVAVGGLAGGAAQVGTGVAPGALVSHSAFGGAVTVPDMLCLEADMLAYSC